MSSGRLPPLLQPYVHPSAVSLTLLTSVLGTTANWLILRFLSAALNPASGTPGTDGDASIYGSRIVLVSFLRDWEFWRTEGRRAGIDLAKGIRDGKACFVDGLTGLFSGHGLGAVEEKGRVVLREAELEKVEREVLSAIDMVKGDGRVTLVIDGADALMAFTGVGAGDVRDLVGELREHVHAVVLAVAADFPLVQARNTPLEIEHAALVMGLAHQARCVISLRGLDTGAARDVSGVMRISRGGQGEGVEDGEWLYLVGGDGGVRVFERGA